MGIGEHMCGLYVVRARVLIGWWECYDFETELKPVGGVSVTVCNQWVAEVELF